MDLCFVCASLKGIVHICPCSSASALTRIRTTRWWIISWQSVWPMTDGVPVCLEGCRLGHHDLTNQIDSNSPPVGNDRTPPRWYSSNHIVVSWHCSLCKKYVWWFSCPCLTLTIDETGIMKPTPERSTTGRWNICRYKYVRKHLQSIGTKEQN